MVYFSKISNNNLSLPLQPPQQPQHQHTTNLKYLQHHDHDHDNLPLSPPHADGMRRSISVMSGHNNLLLRLLLHHLLLLLLRQCIATKPITTVIVASDVTVVGTVNTIISLPSI
jgi:hypothetical protein